MRSTLKLFALIFLGTLAGGVAQQAAAQDEAPAGASRTFGPRKGAQPQGEGGSPAQTIATHGDWQVQCADSPSGQDGQSVGKACGMLQTSKSDKNDKVGLSVIVSRIKVQDGAIKTMMRVLTPIGVYLPTGIPVEIDGAALPNRLVFTRCSPRLCEAFGEPSEESLSKFLKGNDSTFYLYDRPGNGYPLKISLTGFAKALDELDKQ